MTDYQEYLDFLYSALESQNKKKVVLSENTSLVADVGLSSLEVMEFIESDFMRFQALPNENELEEAGLDKETFIRREKAWYDASIRAMDVEIGRLVERLEELGRPLALLGAEHIDCELLGVEIGLQGIRDLGDIPQHQWRFE